MAVESQISSFGQIQQDLFSTFQRKDTEEAGEVFH